ncbi:MAG TPA: hypothetical protein VG273_16560 [Bryobacteraceae bacterium]|nr:hypothetical protein [Bryobacteraceae bacterium]
MKVKSSVELDGVPEFATAIAAGVEDDTVCTVTVPMFVSPPAPGAPGSSPGKSV